MNAINRFNELSEYSVWYEDGFQVLTAGERFIEADDAEYYGTFAELENGTVDYSDCPSLRDFLESCNEYQEYLNLR